MINSNTLNRQMKSSTEASIKASREAYEDEQNENRYRDEHCIYRDRGQSMQSDEHYEDEHYEDVISEERVQIPQTKFDLIVLKEAINQIEELYDTLKSSGLFEFQVVMDQDDIEFMIQPYISDNTMVKNIIEELEKEGEKKFLRKKIHFQFRNWDY